MWPLEMNSKLAVVVVGPSLMKEKVRKHVSKWVPGACLPRGGKKSEKSLNELKSLRKVCSSQLFTRLRLCRPRGTRTHFETFLSADCKRGRRKGATSKNVKNRQKVSKSFSTLFDNFRAGQKTSKIVKKCQKVFRHFSTIFARHLFSGPFCNPLILELFTFRLNWPCEWPKGSQFNIITCMILFFSNYIGDYSCMFQGSVELISITLTASMFFFCAECSYRKIFPSRISSIYCN